MRTSSNSHHRWIMAYQQMWRTPTYRLVLWVLGLPLHIILWYRWIRQTKSEAIIDKEDDLFKQYIEEETRKQAYFKENINHQEIERRARKKLDQEVNQTPSRDSFSDLFASFLVRPVFAWLSILLAWPMFILLAIYQHPLLWYVVQRLVLMVFVILGVSWIVFTLLYLSPSDAAQNILGNQATPEQIDKFNQLHGLDDSYLAQLWRTLSGIFRLDLGSTYVGQEQVADALIRRFPITLQLTVFSLAIALIIAIPSGIYAAIKVNSLFDKLFMFIALIGLSIPTFWLGLIFILNFAIENRWLPATYNPSNPWSLLMPAVVLGTSLAAAVARMTRGTTLDVIHEDYILTARAKGLSSGRIIIRHIIPNALIPVITIIGLQFGGMLGGSAVTEQVFNINGVGKYIVEKQFVPDTPAVLGGVIYIAIVVSIVNLVVDLLYAFIDPRIRRSLNQS